MKNERFDGLIITGAPVEHLPFEQVDYWDELCEIMDWSVKNVYSTMYICWGAQAGLYYRYGIPKYALEEKLSGVFAHHVTDMYHPLTRGFDDTFFVPHSRYSEVREEDIDKVKELKILSKSDEAGIYIVVDKDRRNVYVTGHSEYSCSTLANEYHRDIKRGLNPNVPKNYFLNDDPTTIPIMSWKSHANLLFANWLNHIIYQNTPYDLSEL